MLFNSLPFLIFLPIVFAGEKFSGREPLAQWLATLRTIPHFVVADLDDMECTRSISSDDKHLNAQGAELFSRLLSKELRKNNCIN